MTRWKRSSFCQSGECLEASPSTLQPGWINIRRRRDSDSRPVWHEVVPKAEWDAFVAGVKAGEFDDLAGDDTP